MKHQYVMGLILYLWMAPILGATMDTDKLLAEKYRSRTIQLVPMFTINENTLPREIFFQSPVDIKCDSKGNVYICDSQANQILKFDKTGNFLNAIGRSGQGPGDFNMPICIAVTFDRIFVCDFMNERLCILTLEGNFIKSIPLSMEDGRPDKMKGLPNGDIIIGWEKKYFGNTDKAQEYSIRIFDHNLVFRKMIYSREVWRNKYVSIEGRATNIPQPFSPMVSWDVTTDGRIVIGFQKKYEIEIHDSIKGKIASFSHDYKPIKITGSDKETFYSQLGGVSVGGGDIKGAPDYIIKAIVFPKEKPPFFDLHVDGNGNILVYPYQNLFADNGKTIDVFAPTGQFIASVKLDGSEKMPTIAAFRDDGLWTMKYTKDGIANLVKYKIIN